MTSQACSWRWNFVKLEEHLVLELTVRFELSIPKGGFSWALHASASSSKSLNVDFFLSHHIAH
jgi:hypothetical protein